MGAQILLNSLLRSLGRGRVLCTEHRLLKQLGKSSRKKCKAGSRPSSCLLYVGRREKAEDTATRNQGTGIHASLPSPLSLNIS